MKRFGFLIVLLLFPVVNIIAAEAADTIIINSDESVERVGRDLDSLVNLWYVKLALSEYSGNAGDSPISEFPDSVYVERLARINSVISLPYNNIIRNHIQVYTERKVENTRAILGLKDYYFPIIEDIFDSYRLPAELKYMAVIESALNPNAVSRVGATGMWQFMNSTGRLYGLTINSVIDERRDPVKAAHAAARYLRDMYDIFHDWVLVIAAYNCGPGNVTKAISRSGNRKDYWEIYYRLPRETRGYIPQFIAAAYILNYYKEHKIEPLSVNIPVATDTIMVNKDIHLNQIAEVLNISPGELRALNPQYRTGLIPGSAKPMPLTLPVSHLSDFITLSDTIRNHRPDLYLKKATTNMSPVRSVYVPPDIKGKTKLYYTVKEGDNLGYIAEWYRVGLSELRYWNDIYSNTIRIGQKIAVFVNPSEADFFSKIDGMSFAQKQSAAGKPMPVKTVAAIASADNSGGSDPDYIVYTVRYGDTIWDIVKKYGNVTTTEVLSLNNLTDPDKLYVGQKLKIRKRS